jgi:hypothetical protein
VFEPTEVVELFIGGAHVIASAISDPLVADSWDSPSVLEEQLVSGLAGHLARGGVWAVADYLDAGTASGPVDFESAGEYFASFADSASPEAHRSIRERGAAVASVGRDDLVQMLGERLGELEPIMRTLDPAQLVTVIAGSVMRLSDYLATRIVEQTVHLDDLARSVGHEPWPVPAGARALTISVGSEIARRRFGDTALIRALYRKGFAEPTLPAL